jgi:protein MpaA
MVPKKTKKKISGPSLGFFAIFLQLGSHSSVIASQSPGSPQGSVREPISLLQWCQALRSSVKELRWRLEPCEGLAWREAGRSVNGMPLVYAEFGDPNSTNTTLIFSMIHGDEVTPLYLGLKLAHWLKDWSKESGGAQSSSHPISLQSLTLAKQAGSTQQEFYESIRVVIVPLVNPDSFFRKPRTRTNQNGVDVNRNFGTRDWNSQALAAWKKRFRSDPRRYPGPHPDSEPETLFQRALIEKFRPQKILSIHAPLNFMDYDGPTQLTLKRFPQDYVRECLKLRDRLKAKHGGFFPGSLGNYAGQELGIPTLTLELPSADPRKAEAYWQQFSRGMRSMIQYRVPQVDALSPLQHREVLHSRPGSSR